MIHRFTLDNGLRVVFKEDHQTPVAVSRMTVGAGSNFEWPEVRGWSHGIEHNLFKGTRRRRVGDIPREIREAGGFTNAGTGYTTTSYYILLPSANFDVALDIHADVFLNSAFDSGEFERERGVLVQELEMYRDRPDGFGYTIEDALARMFTRHPYRYPVIGDKRTLLQTPRREVLRYYRAFYVPANMVYVVVGDLDYKQWRPRIERAFAGLKPRPVPDLTLASEPRQRRRRYATASTHYRKGYLRIGFKGPGTLHPDTCLLEILFQLLTDGRGSRLVKLLRDKHKLVPDIGYFSLSCSNASAFLLDTVLDPQNCAAVIKHCFAEIERLRREPVQTRELSKLVKAFHAGRVSARETVEGQAALLGRYELLGDYHYMYHDLDIYRNVTVDDLLRVARQYLSLDTATVMYHNPEGATPPADEQIRDWQQIAATRPRRAKPKAVRTRPDENRFRLTNGMRVFTQHEPRLPLVSVGVFAGYGKRWATPVSNPVPYFLQRLWSRGSRRFSEEEITEKLEDIAGVLQSFNAADITGCYLGTAAQDLPVGFEILSDLVRYPSFPEPILRREQQLVRQQLRQVPDNPRLVAFKNFQQLMFGDRGYGLFGMGDAKSVGRVTTGRLQAAYRKHFTPDNMLLGVVGDFNRGTIRSDLENSFGDFATGRSFQPQPLRFDPVRGVKTRELKAKVNQSVILLGFPGVTEHDTQLYTLEMLAAVLGGMGSRLFVNLRDRRGLCYQVGMMNLSFHDAGAIILSVGVQLGREEEALAALREEVNGVLTDGVSQRELERAKAEFTGQLAVEMQRNSSRLMLFARLEMLGEPFTTWRRLIDRINRVTLAQVNRAAKRYLDLDNCVISIVRP